MSAHSIFFYLPGNGIRINLPGSSVKSNGCIIVSLFASQICQNCKGSSYTLAETLSNLSPAMMVISCRVVFSFAFGINLLFLYRIILPSSRVISASSILKYLLVGSNNYILTPCFFLLSSSSIILLEKVDLTCEADLS